jgi:hypothetical protein
MICIIAGSYQEAWIWARGQLLDKNEWFYPNSIVDLYARENFHVIVASGAHAHADFEMIFKTAKDKGSRNRK